MGYSSPEMIINSPKGLPIDLYGNDAFGLKELCRTYTKKKQKYLLTRQFCKNIVRIKNF
jgi:hypothetical protein